MILGSLVIGFLSGEQGWITMRPFLLDIFYGVLSFFLLDMGISAGSRFNELRQSGWFLIGFSVLMPLFNGAIAIAVAHFIGMSPGDALLLTVLFASASYVAVPAAMSLSVPEAHPSFYISMALALTFPFNVYCRHSPLPDCDQNSMGMSSSIILTTHKNTLQAASG
jgi:hypothetical protein